MKSRFCFSGFLFQRAGISLIVLIVLLMGLGQPSLAATYDTYRSWSYYTDRDNTTIIDDHWNGESSWQGNSSVGYNPDNYAKSLIGFDGGSLKAKIVVSINNSINKVYSSSYYRDDGFNCENGGCGTAVPLGGGFEMQLHQDGSFTLGTANFSLNYYLRTSSTAYNFHFAVQQGEGDLSPYGWFSKENLVSGASDTVYMADDLDFFNLIWEDNNHDGVYNFSYDFSFTGNTNGIDLGEELLVSASASAVIHSSQFFDSYNSFHANVTPDEGISFYRGGHTLNSVPAPNTIFLLGSGVLGLAGISRRKK